MRILLALLLLSLASAMAQTLRDSGAQRGVLMGAAVDTAYIASAATYAATLAEQYSIIEAENEMKWAAIEPTQGVFNFAPGDILVSFAQTNAMELRGVLMGAAVDTAYIASAATYAATLAMY